MSKSFNYLMIIVRVKKEVADVSGGTHTHTHTHTHTEGELERNLPGYDVGVFLWNSTVLTPTPRA